MSHAEGVNIKRRRVLIATTAAIGAVGIRVPKRKLQVLLSFKTFQASKTVK